MFEACAEALQWRAPPSTTLTLIVVISDGLEEIAMKFTQRKCSACVLLLSILAMMRNRSCSALAFTNLQ